jgi:choline/ethanolamine kinase
MCTLFMQAMFPDGRIEEFIEAQSVSAELMATPEVAVSIAAAMAHFHFTMLKHFTMLDHLPSCMSPVAQIWDRLRDWARITSELYKPHELEPYQLIKIRDEVSCSILSGM